MKNIILVEDNKIERRNISRVIENIDGCNLTGAFVNGLDALNFLVDNKVDIVITDVQMALMDGIELIRNIRSRDIETEIIILSGYQDFDNAKSAVGLDVIDYVMKPIINNELEDAIQKAIDKCEEKRMKKADYEQMQQQIESSKIIMREQFMRGLIINSNVDDEYVRLNESLLGISILSEYKSILVIKINQESIKRIIELVHSVKEYVAQFGSDIIKFYPFVMSETEIAVVISSNIDEILYNCIALKNKIINKYGIKLFMALSRISNTVGDISLQYDECKRILEESDESWNVVEVDELYNDFDNQNFEMYKKAKNLVISNDIKTTGEYLKVCLSETEKQADINIKNFAFVFVNLLELILSRYGMSFDDFEILSEKEIWRKLDDFDSIIDINNVLLNLLKSVVEKINEIDNEKVRIVKKIKNIIKEHYGEHITLNLIAREVNFSTKQAHRIFKQETGMTIFQYLTDYRMDIAKNLLLEGKVVDDVVFEVGYKDKKYFYEIFKEKTGLSPKQFKEQGKS